MDKNTSLLAAIASDAVAVKKNLKISRRSGFSSRLRDEMAFRIVCSRGIVSATLPSDPALACLKLSDAPLTRRVLQRKRIAQAELGPYSPLSKMRIARGKI